jgi:hypothetical protein
MAQIIKCRIIWAESVEDCGGRLGKAARLRGYEAAAFKFPSSTLDEKSVTGNCVTTREEKQYRIHAHVQHSYPQHQNVRNAAKSHIVFDAG